FSVGSDDTLGSLGGVLGEFAAEDHNGKDALLMLVIRQDMHDLDRGLLDQAQRIVMAVFDRMIDDRLLRQADFAMQRRQNLGLVLEMPIDRAACYAGTLSD